MKARLITPLEVALIDRLIDAAVRPNDLAEAQVIEVDQWGSIEFFRDAAYPHKGAYALPRKGAYKDSDGVPVLVTLCVDDGDKLSELAIYKLDDSPLLAPLDPARIVLQPLGPGPIIL